MLNRQTLDEQELIEVPNIVVVLLISPKRRLPRGKTRLVRLEVPQRPKSQFYLEVTFSTLPRDVTSQSKENFFSFVYFSRDPHDKVLSLQSVGKIVPALTNFLDLPSLHSSPKEVHRRMSHSSGWPYKPCNDVETGLKKVDVERMNRYWVQAKLYLKASYRFRHTLVLKRAEEKKQAARKLLRAHTQALRAAAIFKQVADQVKGPGDDFPIEPETLASLTRNSDVDALQQYGGKEGLADLLKTNLVKGIDGDDVLERINKFGSNKSPPKTATSHWTCLWEALYDFTRIVLVIAFVGSVVMGIMEETKKLGWHDVFSVAIAAAMFIFITVLSNYTQARLQHMIVREKMTYRELKVIRAGRQVPISICDIVVGDVIFLEFGDEVPADGILIHGCLLAIDKSRVTGESMIFPEDSRKPFLQSGWKVAHGSATMLVTGVGKFTELGILRASTGSKDTKNKTHLQVLLKEVATFMGAVGFMVAAIVAYVVWFRDFFTGDSSNGSPEPGSTLEEVIRISIIAVTIFVVALPEVLPLAFNISRLSLMKKMKADNASVQRPAVCETMALCNDALCDKTGITLDKMTVFEAYAGQKKINFAQSTCNLSPILSSLLAEGIAQNPSVVGSGDVQDSRSPIERAILHWGLKLGMNIDEIRSRGSVMQVLPFNSERKRGGVALNLPNGRVHIHWKGAAERVLASCTRYIGDNDQFLPMDDDKLTFFDKAIKDMASGGLHCVAIAYRSLELDNVLSHNNGQLAQWELPEDDLILLAIVGIKDDVQVEIKESVKISQRAGIKVRLITHDNPQTAKAIAKECGILASDASEDNLIEGKEFRELSDIGREESAEKISVMPRSTPNDKLLFVQALQKRGKVVAVTGYVSNDAQALHEADIGLAMGKEAAEVVKESSDIIVLDGNFATVAKGFRWGRSMHEKVLRVMQQQLTANIVAVTINCLAAVYYRDIPLNAVQFVWVNVIIFGLGPLVLATESPADHLMNVPPIDRGQPLIKYIRLLIQVLYQIIALLVINFQGGSLLKNYTRDHATKVKNTMIFNTFVICQISIEFGVRKAGIVAHPLKWITANSVFLVIVGIILVIQFIIIEFLGKAFFIVRLDWNEWQFSLTLGIVELFFALLLFVKHLTQRNHH